MFVGRDIIRNGLKATTGMRLAGCSAELHHPRANGNASHDPDHGLGLTIGQWGVIVRGGRGRGGAREGHMNMHHSNIQIIIQLIPPSPYSRTRRGIPADAIVLAERGQAHIQVCFAEPC